MAQFCTKCGTAMGEGMSFCTNCGATVGAPAGPAGQPMVSAPVAAAPVAKAGSPILKIVLIVLAVFLFFGLLGIGSCVFFAYRAKQRYNQFAKQAHITFPSSAATREVQALAGGAAVAVNTGIPIYPGATPTDAGGDMSMGAGVIAVQEYVTGDSVDKVIDFYKDKLGSNVSVQQAEGKALLQVVSASGLTNITVFHDDNSGKTRFSITRIGK